MGLIDFSLLKLRSKTCKLDLRRTKLSSKAAEILLTAANYKINLKILVAENKRIVKGDRVVKLLNEEKVFEFDKLSMQNEQFKRVRSICFYVFLRNSSFFIQVYAPR